jgi:uncharacterized OB-fold protein
MRAVSEVLPDANWSPVAPFWAACVEHQLRFPRCRRCGRHQWYPRELCGACLSDDFEWAEIAPFGTIYSYTVVRRPFLAGAEQSVPFTVLQVTFDDAPGVMLLTNLADEREAGLVQVGRRVAVAFTEVSNGQRTVTMPYVRIDPSQLIPG